MVIIFRVVVFFSFIFKHFLFFYVAMVTTELNGFLIIKVAIFGTKMVNIIANHKFIIYIWCDLGHWSLLVPGIHLSTICVIENGIFIYWKSIMWYIDYVC